MPEALTIPNLTEERVLKMLDDFTNSWNQGNLEEACEVYANDASFVSKSGYIRGKDKILERYRKAYPDRSAMGVLTLELLEFRRARPATDFRTPMATAILRWTVEKDGEISSGYVMETYESRSWGEFVIVQDATI